jgi:hypothetical protein
MTSNVAEWNPKMWSNVDHCVHRTYLVLPERQNAKTMEHTLLREVCDFFLFGSRTGLSHQRFGDVVWYLKVVTEVGGKPASVHVESQEKRLPDQQSNRVPPGYESGRLTILTWSSKWLRGHPQTPLSACKIKNSSRVTTVFNHPSYIVITPRHRHAKNIKQRNWRGGGDS